MEIDHDERADDDRSDGAHSPPTSPQRKGHDGKMEEDTTDDVGVDMEHGIQDSNDKDEDELQRALNASVLSHKKEQNKRQYIRDEVENPVIPLTNPNTKHDAQQHTLDPLDVNMADNQGHDITLNVENDHNDSHSAVDNLNETINDHLDDTIIDEHHGPNEDIFNLSEHSSSPKHPKDVNHNAPAVSLSPLRESKLQNYNKQSNHNAVINMNEDMNQDMNEDMDQDMDQDDDQTSVVLGGNMEHSFSLKWESTCKTDSHLDIEEPSLCTDHVIDSNNHNGNGGDGNVADIETQDEAEEEPEPTSTDNRVRSPTDDRQGDSNGEGKEEEKQEEESGMKGNGETIALLVSMGYSKDLINFVIMENSNVDVSDINTLLTLCDGNKEHFQSNVLNKNKQKTLRRSSRRKSKRKLEDDDDFEYKPEDSVSDSSSPDVAFEPEQQGEEDDLEVVSLVHGNRGKKRKRRVQASQEEEDEPQRKRRRGNKKSGKARSGRTYSRRNGAECISSGNEQEEMESIQIASQIHNRRRKGEGKSKGKGTQKRLRQGNNVKNKNSKVPVAQMESAMFTEKTHSNRKFIPKVDDYTDESSCSDLKDFFSSR